MPDLIIDALSASVMKEVLMSKKTEEEKLDCYRRVRDEIRAFIENLPGFLENLPE